MQRKGFIIFLLLFFPILVFGQGLKIKGKVTDNNGEPLLGANVMVADLSIGAATDFDGNYVFDIPSANVNGQEVKLTASYIGFKANTVTIVLRGNTLEQNFVLEEDVFKSEEIVVTGIASRNSKSVAEVSVARVSAKELTKVQSYQGFNQLVAGKISGVQMRASSGNVTSGFRFKVRGGSSLRGDEQPVIYIDGVRMDDAEVEGYGSGGQGMSMLANLNPNDIANIEVLKGPAAAAMYGTSGSNGVILITTKSGQISSGSANNFSIGYKFNYGVLDQTYKYEKEYIQTYESLNDIWQQGSTKDHFFNVAGGANSIQYYASFQNTISEGIVPNDEMDRKSVRVNLNVYPTEDLTIKFNTSYIDNNMSRPENDNNILGYLGNNYLPATPYFWVKKHEIAAIRDQNEVNQFIGSARLIYKPIDKLEVQASIGLDQSDWRQDRTYPPTYGYGSITKGQRSVFNRIASNLTYDFNARYSYDITEKLKATSIIGSQVIESERRTNQMRVRGYDTELVTEIGAGADMQFYGEGKTHTREAGIFTEHQLAYDNTYFGTFGIRKDYASSIGADAPSAYYPKASLAVRIDKFNILPKFVNLFKIRAAYGINGQLPNPSEVIPVLWAALNTGYGTGADISDIGNSSLEPENVNEMEFGFDTELFNKVSFEFTYFRTQSDNSLIGLLNAPSTGLIATRAPFNVGGLKTWGWESLLQFSPIRTADTELGFTFIWNYQNSEVTDLNGEQPIYDGNNINVYEVGMKKSQFYGETTYAKFDADGKYIGNGVTEKMDLGNPTPDHSGSLAINFRFLKNFNFNALVEWGLNNKIYNFSRRYTVIFGANDTEWLKLRAQLGLGEYEGVSALEVGSADYRAAAESYGKLDRNYAGNFIEDADYLYVREVSLSYDFTDLVKSSLGNEYVKSFAAGVSVNNLFRTSKYYRDDVDLNESGSRTLSKGHDFFTMSSPRTMNFWFRVGF